MSLQKSSHYYLFELGGQLDLDFFEQFIFCGMLQRQVNATGSTNYAAVRARDVLEYRVPIPSLDEQKKIAGCLKAVDRTIAGQEEYLSKLKQQKNGLMNRLVTGQLRVKVKETHFV